MAVKIALALQRPSVKLEIDYNDRSYTVPVPHAKLIISSDGFTISLRRDTVDAICRQQKRINPDVNLSIRYIDKDNKIRKFPTILELDNEPNASTTQVMRNSMMRRNNSVCPYLGEKLIKIMLEETDDIDGPGTGSDNSFSFDQDQRREKSTTVHRREDFKTQEQDEEEESDEEDGDLDDILGDLEGSQESKDELDAVLDEEEKEESLKTDSDEEDLAGLCSEFEQSESNGNELEMQKEEIKTFEVIKMDRRPSKLLSASINLANEQPALNRLRSAAVETAPLKMFQQPSLHRSQSQFSDNQPKKVHFVSNSQQLSLEERVYELEQEVMFLTGMIRQIAFQGKHNLDLNEQHNLRDWQGHDQGHVNQSMTTINEEEKSSVTSESAHHFLKAPSLFKFKSQAPLHQRKGSTYKQSSSSRLSQATRHILTSGNGSFKRQTSDMSFFKQQSIAGTSAMQILDGQSIHSGSGQQVPRTNSMMTSVAPMLNIPERVDIVFAYANAFSYINDKQEMVSMSDREIINPDMAFENIVKAVREMNRKLTIQKKILNYASFDRILDSNPRVLVIMCHGQLKKEKGGKEHCFFCFENESMPFLIDKFDEDRLQGSLKDKKIKIDVVILSTCHSERLGKIFVNNLAPSPPAVICINSTDQIAEASTMKFNPKFLQSLLLNNSILEAFNHGRNLVSSMPKEDNRCCCCNHEHSKDCLFIDFVNHECQGSMDKACQILHQDQCDCFSKLSRLINQEEKGSVLDEAMLYISHEHNCAEFSKFFNTLVKKVGRKTGRRQKQLENEHKKGYLQQPLQTYSKTKFNLKCCCQSHMPHRESDKFKIANQEDDEKLQKKNIFESPLEGDPDILKVDYHQIKGLRDNLRSYFPRKDIIREILIFLLKDERKVLIVSGPRGTSKIQTIAKAVHYSVEHQFSASADGAHYIDLNEAETIQDIYQCVIDTLGLTIQKPELNRIVQDTYLRQQRSIIVFQRVPDPSQCKLLEKFWKFIKQLQFNTDLRLIIVLKTDELDKVQDTFSESFPQVKLERLNRSEAIDWLKRVILIEQKSQYVRGVNYETHKIMDVWERSGFSDDQAFYISSKLSNSTSLLNIATDMEKRLVLQQGSSAPQQVVSHATIISGISVVTQMAKSGERLLNDLIIFLTLCPQGLCMAELQILLRRFPTELSKEARDKKIEMYIDLFQAFTSEKSPQLQAQPDSIDREEEGKPTENLKEMIKSLLYFDISEDSDTRVKLMENERPALQFIVTQNAQVEQKIASVTSKELLKIALDFFVPYAKFLLFKIRDSKSNSYADHKFVSASMMFGIWDMMSQGRNFSDFDQLKGNWEAKFNAIKHNFTNICKQQTIEKIEPTILQKDYDDVGERQGKFNMTIIQQLRDLALLIPSTMARLEQFGPAISSIELSRILFNFEEGTKTHAMLNMLHASGIIHQAQLDSNFENMSEFHDLRKTALEFFKSTDDLEGQGENHYLHASLYIMKQKLGIQTRPDSPHGFESFDTRDIKSGSLIEMQHALFDEIIEPTALQCLDESIECFREMERLAEAPVCNFNIARCLYEKANQQLEAYDNEHNSLYQSKVYFEGRKNQIFDSLKEVKTRIKEISKNNNKLHKVAQVSSVYINRFYARVNLLKAKLYKALDEDSEALNFIINAISHLNTNTNQKRKQSVKVKSDVNSLALSQKANSAEEETVQDNSLIQTLYKLKDLIVHKLRMQTNNLFTFAKATPLVYYDGKTQVGKAVSEATRSNFDLRQKITSKLSETRKQFKVKFDILSNKFLKDIAKNGCRLLHLTSDIEQNNKLCVEGPHGICNELPLKSIDRTFKTFAPVGLQIDVVGLALPHSVEIGKIFLKNKVQHVLCFDSADPDVTAGQYSEEDENDLTRFRFNYIYSFCVQFYSNLACQMTVLEAFKSANDWINDDQTQYEEIWQCSELPFSIEDLNIKAVLLDPENTVHNEKLFDPRALGGNQYLNDGTVIDTSKVRGQMIGVPRHTKPYIGHKPELFNTIKALSSRSDVCPLFHISGKQHIGKRRFVEEVCMFFNRHNKFGYIIMQKDLSEIETPKQFKDFMEVLNKQIEAKQSSELAASSIDDSNQEEDDYTTGPRPEILWAFSNADKIKQDFWNRLEPKMLDIYQSNPSVRFLVTTNCDSKSKFNFNCFLEKDDLESQLQQQEQDNQQAGLRRMHTDIVVFNSTKRRIELRKSMPFSKMLEYEAVDLILLHVTRTINHEDFNLEADMQRSIKQQMQLEGVIAKCKGMPYLLLKVADVLNKDHMLWKIYVEKEKGDRLKGTQAHSRAKRKRFVVKVRKDTENLSGQKAKHRSNSKQKGNHKHQSKEKNQGKISKNQKRKDRDPHCDDQSMSEWVDDQFNTFSKSEVKTNFNSLHRARPTLSLVDDFLIDSQDDTRIHKQLSQMPENSMPALSGNALSNLPSENSSKEKVSIKIDFSKTSSQKSVKKSPQVVTVDSPLEVKSTSQERLLPQQEEESKEVDQEANASFESQSFGSDEDEDNCYRRSQSGKQDQLSSMVEDELLDMQRSQSVMDPKELPNQFGKGQSKYEKGSSKGGGQKPKPAKKGAKKKPTQAQKYGKKTKNKYKQLITIDERASDDSDSGTAKPPTTKPPQLIVGKKQSKGGGKKSKKKKEAWEDELDKKEESKMITLPDKDDSDQSQ